MVEDVVRCPFFCMIIRGSVTRPQAQDDTGSALQCAVWWVHLHKAHFRPVQGPYCTERLMTSPTAASCSESECVWDYDRQAWPDDVLTHRWLCCVAANTSYLNITIIVAMTIMMAMNLDGSWWSSWYRYRLLRQLHSVVPSCAWPNEQSALNNKPRWNDYWHIRTLRVGMRGRKKKTYRKQAKWIVSFDDQFFCV